MPIRLRKRIKLFPGVSINIGKTGISTTLGGRGASVTVGHGKTRTNVGIPGSGISYNSIQSNQIKEENNMGNSKSNDEKFCHECGEVIRAKAEICPKCGVRQPAVEGVPSGILNQRKCLSCGFTGQMKTWLKNYNGAQFMAIVLLLFWVLPGLFFIAYGWGKYKCPQCGKVGENTPA